MTTKTKIGLVILIIFIIGAGVFAFRGNDRKRTPITPIQSTPGQTYTMAQVTTHKDATSCWTAINGNVYDLTTWINQHPGGSGAILSICGKDGTAAFNAQHGGQARPEQELANFLIGKLK